MDRKAAQKFLDELLEELAAIEHERWSHWQSFMHSKGEKRADGSLVLPADHVARWEHQMRTSYADLSEAEKQSDRDQVQRYLPVIASALANDKK